MALMIRTHVHHCVFALAFMGASDRGLWHYKSSIDLLPHWIMGSNRPCHLFEHTLWYGAASKSYSALISVIGHPDMGVPKRN